MLMSSKSGSEGDIATVRLLALMQPYQPYMAATVSRIWGFQATISMAAKLMPSGLVPPGAPTPFLHQIVILNPRESAAAAASGEFFRLGV
jgi:hypothetical protein